MSLSLTETLLLSGYIGFSMGLNVIAFLISSFYKRKFGRPSPGLPFVVSFFLAMIFIITLFTAKNSEPLTEIFLAFSLLGSALFAVGGIINLFLTMSRIRK